MNIEEAKELLESNDYCLRHLVSAKKGCPDCAAEKKAELDRRIEEAISVIRQTSPPPPPSTREWTNCDGKLPPINERVELIVRGFRENGKSGRENWCTGKPIYWRKLS